MKILLCHNYYQQRGGEDESFHAEAALLEAYGHEVYKFTLHNDAIKGMKRRELVVKTLWNPDAYRSIRKMIRALQPDLLHCTNIFPLMSPAVYYAAKAEQLPVIQSLRNYRLLCPGATLLRQDRICEDCLGKTFAWPGIWHGCYRNSKSASLVVALAKGLFRLLEALQSNVDIYFTPSEFARQKFIEGGFHPQKIVVKPNFVFPDPQPGSGGGDFAVFVGRLSREKGIDTLLAAWQKGGLPVPLKIIGDGPLAPKVKEAAAACPNIHWLGRKPLPAVLDIIGAARCLLLPSIWYETFGRTIIEAYAKGTPVVAANIGAIAELVQPNRTGFLFPPGNAGELAQKVTKMLANPHRHRQMREAARAAFVEKYSAEKNYEMMMAIYEKALALNGRPVYRKQPA